MRFSKILAPALLSLAVAGCAAYTPPIPLTHPVSSGYFANQGMTIEAVDGSWRLEGGNSFTPPFQSDMYCRSCSDRFFGQADLLDPAELLSAGGERVIVTTDDGTRLNGILVLNQVFSSEDVSIPRAYKFYGPSLRSYELAIPQDRIQQAKTGRTSVAYEVFAEVPAANSVTGQTRTYRSWVLMLSRSPL